MIIITENDELYEAAKFTANHQLPSSNCNTLIYIDEEEMDYCHEHGYTINLDNSLFITINNQLTEEDKIKTTIHEMIHAIQIIRKDFIIDEQVWKGKCYKDTDYKDKPWEEEAYRLEEIIYNEYKEMLCM